MIHIKCYLRLLTPCRHSEKILGVGCTWIHGQRLGSQQQLTGRHGDVLEITDDLDLVVFALRGQGKRKIQVTFKIDSELCGILSKKSVKGESILKI